MRVGGAEFGAGGAEFEVGGAGFGRGRGRNTMCFKVKKTGNHFATKWHHMEVDISYDQTDLDHFPVHIFLELLLVHLWEKTNQLTFQDRLLRFPAFQLSRRFLLANYF